MKKLEIDKNDLKFNIDVVTKMMTGDGKDDNGNKRTIIAVVKANGMGIGLVESAKFFSSNGIRMLAVATVDEAVTLREAKIDVDIINLSPVSNPKDINTLLDNNIILTIGSLEEFEKTEKILEERNEEARCHIKIDTGLCRYGFLYDDSEIIDVFEKSKRLKIEGVFTHFSNPTDKKWTRTQFNRFLDVIAGIRSMGFAPGMLHASSSTAALMYDDMRLNAVRIGSAFQGRVLVKGVNLRKIGTFKTDVAEIKTVPKGYNISYGNTYKTKRETKVAILPVGYTDGLFMKKDRDWYCLKENIISVLIEIKKIFKDNSTRVTINGNKYKIVGRIRNVSYSCRYYWS